MKNILDHDMPVYRFFEEISRIPRESCHEKEISDYLVEFARAQGLWYRRDELNNVFIKKNGTEGYEDHPPVLLQAHMDMVCEKKPESDHDFRKDPIKLVVKDRHLMAEDTSLGADDGFGMAYMLTLLADEGHYSHPPLECLFTIDEESGMTGARGFDVSDVESRTLINLDSEQEGVTYVGCVCSDKTVVSKNLRKRVPCSGTVVKMTVDGITGDVFLGGSDPEVGNAIKMSFRMLAELLDEGIQVGICSAEGGTAENRNPLSCEIIFSCDEDYDAVTGLLEKAFNEMMERYRGTEFSAAISFERAEAGDVVSPEESDRLIRMMYLMESNTFASDIATGKMEALHMLGVIELNGSRFTMTGSTRARHRDMGEELCRHIRYTAETFGCDFARSERIISWQSSPDSRIKALFNEVLMEKQGVKLKEDICPGGLEISVFVRRIPGLDAITIGPTHENVHTFHEYLDMDSYERTFDVLTEVLRRM